MPSRRYRDHSSEPEDQYKCARFIHRGKVIFRGKQAVDHFCMIQRLDQPGEDA
jgi:hypothetical protein